MKSNSSRKRKAFCKNHHVFFIFYFLLLFFFYFLLLSILCSILIVVNIAVAVRSMIIRDTRAKREWKRNWQASRQCRLSWAVISLPIAAICSFGKSNLAIQLWYVHVLMLQYKMQSTKWIRINPKWMRSSCISANKIEFVTIYTIYIYVCIGLFSDTKIECCTFKALQVTNTCTRTNDEWNTFIHSLDACSLAHWFIHTFASSLARSHTHSLSKQKASELRKRQQV